MLLYEEAKSGIEACEGGEKYVTTNKTVVRWAFWVTWVQTALSCLFASVIAMVMVRLTDVVRQEAPWSTMFADDIVVCGDSR